MPRYRHRDTDLVQNTERQEMACKSIKAVIKQQEGGGALVAVMRLYHKTGRAASGEKLMR